MTQYCQMAVKRAMGCCVILYGGLMASSIDAGCVAVTAAALPAHKHLVWAVNTPVFVRSEGSECAQELWERSPYGSDTAALSGPASE